MLLIDSDVLLAYTRGHLSLLYYWRFRLVIIHGHHSISSLPASIFPPLVRSSKFSVMICLLYLCHLVSSNNSFKQRFIITLEIEHVY
ncbi:MAG TPA: hypothetical protein VNX00_14010 [Herbaspirillum sp.]|jgi:hypothetical protein|nr:hypothetical protein [Herbaspirillum sp.]